MTLGCGTARKDCLGKVAETQERLWGVSLSLIIQSVTTQILGGENLDGHCELTSEETGQEDNGEVLCS